MRNLYKYELTQVKIGEYDEKNLTKSIFSELQLHTKPNEEMWMIAMDNILAVKGVIQIAKGGKKSIMISTPSIARDIVMLNPEHILIIHNHPSGEPKQSKEDIKATKKIKIIAETLGVKMAGSWICYGENKFKEIK